VNPIEFVFGLLMLVAAAIAIMLFGEAFRAHIFLFIGIWLLLPSLSVFIRKWELFDVKSLRQQRIFFMAFVFAVSWIVFWGWDDVRNYIGNHYIEGYRHWTIEIGENDNGEMTYGQDWSSRNTSGTWTLNILQVISVILAVGLPVLTWKSFDGAIQQRIKREDQPFTGVDQTNEKL
jgi:hypothetical protein